MSLCQLRRQLSLRRPLEALLLHMEALPLPTVALLLRHLLTVVLRLRLLPTVVLLPHLPPLAALLLSPLP